MAPTSPTAAHRRAFERLRTFALAYPESTEDFPWGEPTWKVRGKIFAFCGVGPDGLYVTVKLPESDEAALTMPQASPTGYGLGRHHWVSVRFARTDTVPVDVVEDWIDESYRAVAPKTLVKRLPAR